MAAAREKGSAPATPPPAPPIPVLLPATTAAAAAAGDPPPLHAPVPSALLFSPALATLGVSAYRPRWSPGGVALASRRPADLAHELVDELGLGLRSGGVLGVHAGAMSATSWSLLHSRPPRGRPSSRGAAYASAAFSHAAQRSAQGVAAGTSSDVPSNALTAASGKYRTTHDQMLDLLGIVDNASRRRQESYLECKMNFLRQASILEDLGGGHAAEPTHARSRQERLYGGGGSAAAAAAGGGGSGGSGRSSRGGNGHGSDYGAHSAAPVGPPLSGAPRADEYEFSARSILEPNVLRRCNETFSLLCRKDGDGKVDLEDLLGTLAMVPDIASQPLTHIAAGVGFGFRADSDTSVVGSATVLPRPTVADEMRFLRQTCTGRASWLDFKTMFHVNPAARQRAREFFTVVIHPPPQQQQQDQEQQNQPQPQQQQQQQRQQRHRSGGSQGAGTGARSVNFGSRAEYNEQRRLQASIDSMGLSASSLLQKVNLPRSPYEPSFADIPTGESKIRVRDTGGNDDSSTNRPAQDERGIEEKRGDDSKAAAASAAAAAQDTSAAADGNIVDMYKVVALVIGSRGVHPGPRSRTSRLL